MGCSVKNYKHSTFPKKDGVLITTTAASETQALEGAKKESQIYAKEKGWSGYIVVDGPNTEYQGPQKSGAMGIVGGVADTFIGRDKSQDWKCSITICEDNN